MTLKQAAQQALDVQNACNFSGVLRSLHLVVQDVLWPEANRVGQGSRWVATHPIVTMFMLKLAELNGFDSTLNPAYEPAEAACKAIAAGCYEQHFSVPTGEACQTCGIVVQRNALGREE